MPPNLNNPSQMPSTKSDLVLGRPSSKRQQWGVVISIVIIVLMIVIGAFYAWGKRIAQENALLTPTSTQ